jgi:hypothetical protein
MRTFVLTMGMLLSAVFSPAFAQQTATQNVSVVVERVTQVSVSGNPQPLALLDLDAQDTKASVTDQSTSYSLFTNVENARITASIDAPVPPGTTLRVNLDSVLGVSPGLVDISQATQAVDVVTGIRPGVEADRTITYIFSADLGEAEAFNEQTRTVIFTVVE